MLANSVADTEPFQFLDLTPELRNHVYDYACHNDRRYKVRLKQLLGPRKWEDNYTGLTIACKQLHSEFNPLLRLRATGQLIVRKNDIPAFAETFFSERVTDVVLRRRDINVDLEGIEDGYCWDLRPTLPTRPLPGMGSGVNNVDKLTGPVSSECEFHTCTTNLTRKVHKMQISL